MKKLIVAAVAALALVGVGSAAYASIPSSDGTIYPCA